MITVTNRTVIRFGNSRYDQGISPSVDFRSLRWAGGDVDSATAPCPTEVNVSFNLPFHPPAVAQRVGLWSLDRHVKVAAAVVSLDYAGSALHVSDLLDSRAGLD